MCLHIFFTLLQYYLRGHQRGAIILCARPMTSRVVPMCTRYFCCVRTLSCLEGYMLQRLFRSGRSQFCAMLFVLILGFVIFVSSPANAVTINEFTVPTANSNLGDIATGPDGNLWFTEFDGNKIGRITTAGAITEFTIPTTGSTPYGITAGPDGNLWFAEMNGNKIGRITTSGAIAEFTIPTASSYPITITSGPDGNLWFAEAGADKIGRITTSGVITEFAIGRSGCQPTGITAGPDGNLWFTEQNGDGDGGTAPNYIGRITTSGVITEFLLPTVDSDPYYITAGPDGNLWFAENDTDRIGKITTSGVITEFTVPTVRCTPNGIAAGPDGNIWFTEWDSDKVGRITTAGIITEFTLPSGSLSNEDITAGPDGNIWFTEGSSNKIGRLILPTKIGVFDNGYWYLDSNMSWAWDGTPTDTLGVFGVGLAGAVPVVGDWTGSGTAKIGVYTNGTWYLDVNRNWQWDGTSTDAMYSFGAGLPDAIPVVGDWNHDGKTKIGIYSDGVWYLDANGNGKWDGVAGGDEVAYFGVGLTGAVPVVGDWNGDGKTKIGIYQNGYWYLDTNGNGQWDGQSGGDTFGVFGIGLTNAVPVVGDWNADGTTEIGIYQNGYWYLDMNRSWQWDGQPTDQFGVFGVGLTNAVPVPGKW